MLNYKLIKHFSIDFPILSIITAHLAAMPVGVEQKSASCPCNKGICSVNNSLHICPCCTDPLLLGIYIAPIPWNPCSKALNSLILRSLLNLKI
jgi:hypothetical protein